MMFWNPRRLVSQATARTRTAKRSLSRRRGLAAIEALEGRQLLNSNLLLDINRAASNPQALISVGSSRYFLHQEGTDINLYRSLSNGTPTSIATFPTVVTVGGSPQSVFQPGAELENARIVGNRAYFVANDGTNGRELWMLDDSTGQAQMVRNINPGSESGLVRLAESTTAVLNNVLYFTATDGATGYELYRSDGTSNGTFTLGNINGTLEDSRVGNLTVFGNRVYFTAENPATGRELYRTNANGNGVEPVSDIYPGATGSDPAELTVSGGVLYFSANHPTVGRELWRLNSAATGVELMTDLRTGTPSSDPISLVDAGGTLGYSALDNGNVRRLGISQGTVASSRFVTQPILGPTAFLGSLAAVGTDVVHTVSSPLGTDLWVYHAATDTTEQLLDLFPDSSTTLQLGFTTLTTGGRLYFAAIDPATSIQYLGATNGSPGATAVLGTFNPGGTRGQLNDQGLWAGVNGRLYFANTSAANGTELWSSDGTAASTIQVRDINPGAVGSFPRSLGVEGGSIAFIAGSDSGASQIWTSNGTAQGTQLRTNLGSFTASSLLTGSNIAIPLGSSTVFFADDAVHGREPWITNGTAAGTRMLADLNPSGSTDPLWATSFDGNAYVFALRGLQADLWQFTNGTTPAANLVGSIDFLRVRSQPVALNGAMYFAIDNGSKVQLVRTNGEAGGGLQVIKEFQRDGTVYSIDQIAVSGGKLYFVVDDSINNRQLWTSDGTTPGTTAVANATFPRQATGTEVASIGNLVYFRAGDASTGFELYSLNTSDGTVGLHANVAPGGANSSPANFRVVGSSLYFTATNSTVGQELWRTGGTRGNFSLVGDIRPSGDGVPGTLNAIAMGTKLYFIANNGTNGSELWIADSVTNTLSTVDINPGAGSGLSSSKTQFVVRGNNLYFNADNGVTGNELWTVDSGGTRLFENIAAGAASSNPQVLGTTPAGLVLAADSAGLGRELYLISNAPGNNPPALAAISDKSIVGGATLNVPLNASDPDPGQTVSLTVVAGQDLGASIVGSNFVWTPPAALGTGIFDFTVRATDSANPPLFSDRSFRVTVTGVNNPPVITQVGSFQWSAGQDAVMAFAGITSDPDPGQTLTYSIVSPPVLGAQPTINPATGRFSWIPNVEQLATITIRATDNGQPNLSGQMTFQMLIVSDNKPPVITQIGSFNWQVGQTAQLAFGNITTDPNPGQTLTYSIVSPLVVGDQPTIDPATGLFRWTPSAPQQATITIRATDNGNPNLSGDMTFQMIMGGQASRLTGGVLLRVGTSLRSIQMRFDGPLNPSSARSLSRFRLVTPGRDRRINTADDVVQGLRTAVYNASNNTITLTPARAFNTRTTYMLTLTGLLDSVGRPVSGRLLIRAGRVTVN